VDKIIIECLEENGLWVFFCPYCKKKHRHGRGEGMRMSHCFKDKSPNFGKDYYLILRKAK
jgi:hypothetical protein